MNRATLEKVLKNLREIRLPAMAEQLFMMIESNELVTLSIEEVLERLSDEELTTRRNHTCERLKKLANLPQRNSRLEELDYRPERQINKNVIEQLKTNEYIMKHRNVILMGACGTGKTFIANALATHCCESFYSAYYCRMFEFIDECTRERNSAGSIQEVIMKYAKPDLLIIDDFLIYDVSEKDAHYLFQLMEYRYGCKSTIICSQLEPSEWHVKLGGKTLADSILDRIVPSSYKLILYGDSMR